MEPSTTDRQPDQDTMDSCNSEISKSKSQPTSPTPAAAKDDQDPAAETQPEADAGNDEADSLFDRKTPAFDSLAPTPAPVQTENHDDGDQETGAQSPSKAQSPAPETQSHAQSEHQPETQNESQQLTQPGRPSSSPGQRRPSTANSSDSDLSSIGPTPWKRPNTNTTSKNGPVPGHPNTNTTANNGPPPSHPNANTTMNNAPPSGHANLNTTTHNAPPPGFHPNVQPRPAPSPHPNGIYGVYGQPPPDPGPKPMPPAPAVHGPFTYDKDGFKALGFKRETPYNLNMIMRDPNAAPPIEPVAKAWFHAQLIHYSIPVNQPPHSAEPLSGDLFYALENALRTQTIREGKNPPADILTIEDNLRRQFKTIYKQYKEAFSYWEQQNFARCATPTDEINCSLNLFMAKYFLKGPKGRPDPRKTRWPIILHKLNDYDGTRKVVKAVPGLRSHMMPLWSVICWEEYGIEKAIEEAFASIAASHPSITIHVPTMEAHFHIDYFLSKYWLTGLYGRPMPMLTQEPIIIEGWFGGPDIRNILTQAVLRVPDLRVWAFIGNGIDKTVIGWGDKPFQVVEHLRVTSMHQQAASTASQRVEIQGNPTWELALRPHFHLCQVKADLLTANPQQAYEAFEIEELVGSWLVQCPALENGGWGGHPGEMTIDILNWPVDSYGLVASINLKVALGTLILARSERSLDDLSAYLLHDPEVLPHVPHQKRRRGDDFFVEYPPCRRSPYEPVPPLRIFFDWIGRRAGEFDVELDMDPANRNRGWVDIDMNNKVFGKGWFKYVKFFGKDNPVAFSMYKVMDQPRKMPEQWSNFRPKQMTAQLQRQNEQQMQRPIAQPRGEPTRQQQQQSDEMVNTSRIPQQAAADHVQVLHEAPPLPGAPPPPPQPLAPAPPIDIPGFPVIRPRGGIQVGVQTLPGRKRRRFRKRINKPPAAVDGAQQQGDGEGSSGQGQRDASSSTPMEGEGHEEDYRSEEEDGEEGHHEEGQEEGSEERRPEEGPEAEQPPKNEQRRMTDEEQSGEQAQEQEQSTGQEEQADGRGEKKQEGKGQEKEDEGEDEDQETYGTPAEEAPSASAPPAPAGGKAQKTDDDNE